MDKKRPTAKPVFDHGNDGWDAKWIIEYRCPTCGKHLWIGYRSETACDNCGTFFDWGTEPPIIRLEPHVEWKED